MFKIYLNQDKEHLVFQLIKICWQEVGIKKALGIRAQQTRKQQSFVTESNDPKSIPVFDFNLSLDTVCPMRSYCSRLELSWGTSTENNGPFFHV